MTPVKTVELLRKSCQTCEHRSTPSSLPGVWHCAPTGRAARRDRRRREGAAERACMDGSPGACCAPSLAVVVLASEEPRRMSEVCSERSSGRLSWPWRAASTRCLQHHARVSECTIGCNGP